MQNETIFPSTVADGTRVSLGGNRIVEVLETAVPGDLWLTDGTMNVRGNGEYAFIKTTAGTLHLPDAAEVAPAGHRCDLVFLPREDVAEQQPR